MVEELFVSKVSSDGVATVTVFVTDGYAAVSTLTVMAMLKDEPTANGVIDVQVTVAPEITQVIPSPAAVTGVSPVGNVSVMEIGPGSGVGPLLVMVRVYPVGAPTRIAPAVCDLTMARST